MCTGAAISILAENSVVLQEYKERFVKGTVLADYICLELLWLKRPVDLWLGHDMQDFKYLLFIHEFLMGL